MKIEPSLSSTTIESSHRKDSPDAVRSASSQFEGLLISQMLKTARESSVSSSEANDHAEDSIHDMAEQQLSSSLAASGGFGLSRLLVQGLSATKSTSKGAIPGLPAI